VKVCCSGVCWVDDAGVGAGDWVASARDGCRLRQPLVLRRRAPPRRSRRRRSSRSRTRTTSISSRPLWWRWARSWTEPEQSATAFTVTNFVLLAVGIVWALMKIGLPFMQIDPIPKIIRDRNSAIQKNW